MNETSHEFKEGYDTYNDGKSMLHDNPYEKTSESWKSWACGYGSAWSEAISDCDN